jgi:hypothetical protein
MIITGTIIGGISFGIQAYNSWSNEANARKIREAQEAFQRAALSQNLEESKRLFEEMLATRREVMEEERQNQLDILREQHKENIRTIEYVASLDKWPLAVHPLVMRNDNLFYDEKDVTGVVPVNVVFGPCHDRSFQTSIWKRVEEELAIRFSTYWGTTGTHPIIFLQDAWKDEYEQADSAMCANIRAKVKHTPTIVMSPVITNDGLQIDLTHWCVEGVDETRSYKRGVRLSLNECCHHYMQDDEYEEEMIPDYVKELADMIESMVGFLDDQYMWLKYCIVPQFPTMLQGRIEIDDDGRELVYRQYVDMLKSSLENGHVNVVANLNTVLAYCLLIDNFGGKHDAFAVILQTFYGKNLLTDMRKNTPAYDTEKLMTFLSFCKDNQKVIALPSEKYHDMRCGVSMVKLSKDSQGKYEEKRQCMSAEEAKKAILHDEFIETTCAYFSSKCENACDEVIAQCRKETDSSTDRRDWCRPKLLDQMKEFFNDALEKILEETDRRTEQLVESLADNSLHITWDEQQNDKVVGVMDTGGDRMTDDDTSQMLLTARSAVRSYARSRMAVVSHEFWKDTYMKESIDDRLYDNCNAFLEGWIKYRFMKEDLFYDSLSEEAKENIKQKLGNVCEMIYAVNNNYLDLLFSNREITQVT